MGCIDADFGVSEPPLHGRGEQVVFVGQPEDGLGAVRRIGDAEGLGEIGLDACYPDFR